MHLRQAIRPFASGLLAVLPLLVGAQLSFAQDTAKTLRVVGDENYPPYLFLNSEGKEEGFLVDVWKLWEAKTGVKVELKGMKWELAQRTLLDGKADVIEDIFEIPERAAYYDYSAPYADIPVAIYRDVSISGITTLAALRGFKVGVMEGDACSERLRKAGIADMAYYPDYTRLIQGALAQDIKVFCIDEYPANFYLYRLQANRQLVKAFALGQEQFHRAVRKGDLATLRLVEQGMAAISEAEMAALRDKWLSPPSDYRRYAENAGFAVALLLLALALLALWIYTLRRTVADRLADVRRTEAILRERDEQLRTLGDNLPGGFVYQFELRDGQPHFHYLSAGVEGVLEQTPEAVLATPTLMFDCIEPEAKASYVEAEERSAREMSDFSLMLPIRVPSGQRKWVHLQSRPRRLPSGGILWDGIALDATQRMEIQQRLSESESLFRRLFEDSRQASAIFADGSFVAANRAMLEMLQLDHEQFVGIPINAISPERQPDGQLSAEKAPLMARLALEKGGNEFEWEHLRANGEHFFVSVLNTVLNMGGKQVLYVVWRDITEQKKAQQELDNYRRTLEQRVEERTAELQATTATLNETNQSLQAILNGTSAGILLVRERRIVQCNRRLEDLFGYPPGALDGEPTRRLFVDEADWAAAGVEMYAALAAGQSYAREQKSVRRDGSTFWVRFSASCLVIGDAAQGVIGMVEDITTAREAAEALRKATEEQQAVFDAATVGIMLTRKRVIQRCNRTMETLFGYGPDELLGQSTRILYPDEANFADVSARMFAGVAEHGYFREESLLMRKDSSLFWCRKIVQAIDRNDPDKGFAGTFDDITLERNALDEMARARQIAEEAAKTKADFLATMSHEIRTPMNSVIGMTHLALKFETSPKVRDYLHKIESSSQLLLGVINDILDISKLEAQRMTLEHADLDLEKLLDEVSSLFADKTASKGIELIVEADARMPTQLRGDALRLKQILVNLLSNALKFTEHGEISLRLSAPEASADNILLRCEVRDTGIGIAPEVREKLFQAFQQADSSTTRKYGGTGLGLAICKSLVELMGGSIGVSSTPGVGSCFWFCVRLDVASGQPRRPRAVLRSELRTVRVLVVDDNESARLAIGDMARGLGMEAVLAADGEDALRLIDRADADRQPFAIVLLDWQMPGIDGITLAREIQRRQLRHMPLVLMITGFDRSSVADAAAQVGIADILLKPVTPSTLFDAINRRLGAGEAGPAAADAEAASALLSIDEIAGARALLVEDNELNREVASEFLREFGLHCDFAENGAVALRKLAEAAYDVVLMDMQMPVMDGLTATREIRKLPGLEQLPILAMTANAMAGDRERCLAAGMNAHIAKPIDPAELAEKLRQWVRPTAIGRKPEGESEAQAEAVADADVDAAGATEANAATPAARALAAAAPAAARAAPALATASTAESAALAAFTAIEGLDCQQGLFFAQGKLPLYFKLLEHYCAGQKNSATRIAEALQAGRNDEAERLAHTLKGVSATIGATAMRDLAERLEHALHQGEGEPTIRPLLDAIGAQLPPLIAAISQGLPPAPVAPAGEAIDAQHWQAVRDELVSKLAGSDFASLRLFHDNSALLRAALGSRYEQAARAVDNFEFAEALAIIRDADPALE